MDIKQRIENSPMSAFQWLVVAVCTFLNALDGFDVLAMAFTANQVSEEFSLNGAQLGVLLSAGLFGMAAGSLFLAPFADLFGRRPMLLGTTGLAAAGMFLSSTADSMTSLAIWRIVTGLGVGGILACTNVITSEYSNGRWRGMAVSIYTAGYGVGATLGGMAAVWLQAHYGWRSVFIFGGVLTMVAFAALLAVVPESVDFLLTRRTERTAQKLGRLARRMRLGAEDIMLPEQGSNASASGRNAVFALFSPQTRRVTTVIWVAFFAVMFGFYFVNSWTPKLLVTAGMTESQGVVGGLMLTLGGTFGSLLFGALTAKWAVRKVLIAFTVLSSVLMVVFISAVGVLALAFVLGVLVGMLINGCVAGLYTLAPASYAPQSRGTGVGWAIGIGRFGAILAPLAAGTLLDASWTAGQLYLGVGVVVLAAAAALALLRSPGTGSAQQPATAEAAAQPAKAE